MAVRDDFTAGEVLAAADLNDTFASKLPYSYGTATPSTTDSGFLWYDSNSTPAAPKFWDGSAFTTLAPAPGLELITTETFSSVSSVSINGCFSATYDAYRVILRTIGSGNSSVRYRNRLSGVDATTNYDEQNLYARTASVSADRGVGNTNAQLGVLRTVLTEAFVDIYGVALAERTGIFVNARDDISGFGLQITTNAHTTATAYDGFTIFPNSGTFSGTVRVYGYKN